jgi:hypothetical protein
VTIAISVKINDGVVLATDSASSVIGTVPQAGGIVGVSNIYNNANKAFNLRKGLPIGAITWGAGGIGNASISTLVKDLRERFSGRDPKHPDWELDPDKYTVEDVAKQLRKFIFEENYVEARKTTAGIPDLGFIVAGYSAGAALADEYLVEITNGNCPPPRPMHKNEESGISWAGMGEALNRLVLGFGTGLPVVMQRNLGVPANQIQTAIQAIQGALQVPLALPAMPLQDAIDLAKFLADLSINFSRFAPGAPVVGGPIEIAAISKHEGFRWVTRKFYFDRNLNPPEDEHGKGARQGTEAK